MDFEQYAARVLDVVDAIPAGRVMSYGDIAAYLGLGGPRQVGRVMSHDGGAVAWWRVVHADGSPPAGHRSTAARRWREEGTPLVADGTRVVMAQARWQPSVT